MGSLTPALRIALASILLSGLAVVPACGSESKTTGDDGSGGSGGASASGGASGNAGTAGRGGSGGKSGSGGTSGGTAGGGGVPSEVACGATTCEPQEILGQVIPACCTTDEQCGLDSSALASFGAAFEEACQARDQPGALDPACPASVSVEAPDSGIPITFQGCCRSDGRCGYMVDSLFGVAAFEIGLGCVDSQPFLDGGAPAECDPNAPGGSGGAAGASNASGAAGEAGGDNNASGAGGAGGDNTSGAAGAAGDETGGAAGAAGAAGGDNTSGAAGAG